MERPAEEDSDRPRRRAVLQLLRLARTPGLAAVGWMLAASIAGRLAAFAMTIVIVRRLGPESYGVFTFATSTVLLAAQLGGLGWPLLVTHFLHRLSTHGWGQAPAATDNAAPSPPRATRPAIGIRTSPMGRAVSHTRPGACAEVSPYGVKMRVVA